MSLIIAKKIIGLFVFLSFFPLAYGWASSGSELAQQLNSRYQSTVESCAKGNPADFCSGIYLKALPPETAFDFWQPSEQEARIGSVILTYLRKDTGESNLAGDVGYILSDRQSMQEQGKWLTPRCLYPLETGINQRRDHGCALLGQELPANNDDLSSCSRVSVNNAVQWLSYFSQQGNNLESQCSFSAYEAEQFIASIEVNRTLAAQWKNRALAVLFPAWSGSEPKKLPLEAIFYKADNRALLVTAWAMQARWHEKTGQWLPVLRLDLKASDNKIFGFDPKEQLTAGYQVIENLNKRYADTRLTCPGDRPAYACRGILLRITDADPSFHSWDPSPASVKRNGVSFSFIGADVGSTSLNQPGVGVIMHELNYPTAYPLTVRCSYPSNGYTEYRLEACAQWRGYPASRPCIDQNITQIPAWVSHYSRSTNGRYQCLFWADTQQFKMSLEVRGSFPNPNTRQASNEVVVAPWPQNIGDKIPLQAIFYQQETQVDKKKALLIQKDYFLQTGLFLPVIKVDLLLPDNLKFNYNSRIQFSE